MDHEALAALDTPAGAAALEMAGELALTDPLRAASTLRARGVGAALGAAALTQIALRRAAETKFGEDATRMFFTRTGLEQATRSVVATRRAQRLAGSGVTSVADLGCGIGADTIAFARAGLRVLAVDAAPATAAVAAANVRALGLDHLVRVSTMDATEVDLSTVDAVFCDPARRTGSGRRTFDPAAYSPPWRFVAALPDRVPHTVLKLAPGIDHTLLPDGAEGEWVSVDGDLVEATAWCGPLADTPRRATVLKTKDIFSVLQVRGSGAERAPVGPVGSYLYDPDPAVVRAHLVAEFASTVDGVLADESIAYVYTQRFVQTPLGRAYRVVQPLPIALKRMRAALRELDIGRLTILKRGSALDVEQVRRDLRLTGSRAAVLALTRVGGAPAALLLAHA